MKKEKRKIFFEPLDAYCSLFDETFSGFDVERSYQFCKTIAKNHYENFPVGSFLIPRGYRRFFYSIYTFARLADDIADSNNYSIDSNRRHSLLNKLESNISVLLTTERINNPVFLALKDTIERKELPLEPFLKLLTAFKMDVSFAQPENWNDLEKYCNFSANPVGELVLRLFGEYNQMNIEFSNRICTGLQLANFWQDLSIDIPLGRIYIPKDVLKRFGLDFATPISSREKDKLELCFEYLIHRTREYLLDGWKLVLFLRNKRLRFEINAIVNGGVRILAKEKRLGSRLIRRRPRLNFLDYLLIFFNVFL